MISKYVHLCLGTLLFMTACGAKDNSVSSEDALKLYDQSVALLRESKTKMEAAKDSAQIISAFDNVEKGLQKLNYEYGAGTDEKISESENDTLISMIKDLRYTRDSLLRTDLIRNQITPDTTANLNAE